MPHRPVPAALVAASLALLTFAVFLPLVRASFVNIDDGTYVTENPYVIAGLRRESIVWAFTNVVTGHWHPVVWLSHMLDCELYGLNPAGHHLTSVLLHAGNTVLLFALLLRTTGALRASAVAAALFGVHPLRVESVAWIAERKDVLSVFFGFLSLHAWVRYSARPSGGRYVAAALWFTLAVMTKPMLVTLPFVLLLLDYWPLGRFDRSAGGIRLLVEKLPLCLVSAAIAIVTFLAARSEGAITGLQTFSPTARLANAALAYATYLRKVVWPTDLAVFYPLDPAPPLGPALASGALVAAITAAAVVGRRRWPYVFVGWLWFVGTLVPVAGLVQAGLQAMADRFTYLPLAGLFVGAVWLVEDVCRRARVRPSAVVASASVIVAAFAMTAWRQVGYWKDGETLFTRALAVTKDNWMAHDSLGYALLQKGDVAAASDHFEQAIRIRPEYALAHYNLGVARMLQGRLDEAEAQFAAAIRWKPNYADAEFNLGIALTRQGNNLEAIGPLSEAVRDDPRSAAAHAGLGSAFLSVGRTDEAVAQLSEAVRLKPDFAAAHFNLAGALARQGKHEEASSHYARAFALDPALRAGAR